MQTEPWKDTVHFCAGIMMSQDLISYVTNGAPYHSPPHTQLEQTALTH